MKSFFRNVSLAFVLIGGGTASAPQVEAAIQQPRLSMEKIMNVSHRGASGHAPEHTLASYELSRSMQGDYIEIDVQMTRDGELIAMHDETVDRTTNDTGLVKSFTLKEIKELDAGTWFNEAYPDKARPEFMGLQVPTLREIFERFGTDAKYYIETKSSELYPGLEIELLEILNEFDLIGENAPSGIVLIQSFSSESLKRIHQMDDSVPLIQLLSYYSPAAITNDELSKLKEYAVGIGMHFTAISPGYVKKVRESGLMIHPYTVNEKEDMEMLLDWGVTGMFTNYPDRLRDVIKKKKKT